jgi:hypothetical protein
MAITVAAVTLPDPVRAGLAASIFRAQGNRI